MARNIRSNYAVDGQLVLVDADGMQSRMLVFLSSF